MKMTTVNNKNRVGIYTQESVEATATGDGFSSQGDKSPVVNPEGVTMKRNHEKLRNPFGNCANNRPFDQDDWPDQNYSQSGDDRPADEYNSQHYDSSKGDDSHSNYSGGNGGLKIPMREDRDRMNRNTDIVHLQQCEQYYGKNRWSKTIGLLKKIGFVNWEVNTMLGALDSLREDQESAKQNRKRPHPAESIPNVCEKAPRHAGSQQKSTDVERTQQPLEDSQSSVAGTIQLYISVPPTPHSDIPIRINIGDASHPQSYILPENELKLEEALMNLLNETKAVCNTNQRWVKVAIYRIFFINHKLVAECKNAETVDTIRQRLLELNCLWRGANLVVCDRVGANAKIAMFIEYSDMKSDEILDALEKQNQIDTSSWKVIKQEDVDEGLMCLHLEIDALASVRLFHDQDDLYFLLKRVMVKLLQM